MKARGTVWIGLISLLCATAFGIYLVMAVTGVWITPNHRGAALPGVIGFGAFALIAFGGSRMEDDEETLSTRERHARERLEKELADIERRRKALP